ncbi:MAG: diguanylate phosphodiesterase [Piscirickettsiaceae bacterium]|nr:MAG: diguanylate phosphodiesterase [Piscirickettsiaceae bacterium]
MEEFSFARQPILDSSLKLFAYEFLYRPTNTSDNRPLSLTSVVLTTAIIDIGLDKASNNHLAFINMSYEDLMGEHIEALPADRFILELLEDIKPDQTLNNRVKALVEKGYSFALDDFVYSPDWDPLIELADIIKLDLTITTLAENKTLISQLKGKKLRFLAEKVETHQEYEDYKSIGCDLFQGYFFCRPEKISGTAISEASFAKTELIARVNQSDISINELQNTIQQDPALTYKLIKYLNSAYFSFSTPIGTIKHAITILGMDGIKKWATILCLRSLSTKPLELIRVGLVRAKLAELIAIKNNENNPNSYFLMGMLSIVDSLLNSSMEDAIKTLPLAAGIINALLNKSGDMGQVLTSIIEHEQQLAVPTSNISDTYIEACLWADQISNSI